MRRHSAAVRRALTSVALAVLLLPWVVPGPCGAPVHRTHSTEAAWRWPSVGGPAPSPPVTTGAVLETVSLLNGSRWSGNVRLADGVGPVAVAYDGVDHRVFVAVAGPPAGVVVIDPSSGSVTRFLPIGLNGTAEPTGLVFDPADDRLFVADGTADQLSILNAGALTWIGNATLGNGTAPGPLAYDGADGEVFATEPASGRLVPVTAATGSVGSAIATGGRPDAILYDPLVQRLIVADGSASRVTLVDPSHPTNLSDRAVGSRPDGVAFDPDSAQVLVANAGSDNVTVLNLSTLRTDRSYGAGRSPGSLVVSSTGVVYVPNEGSDNVSVIDNAAGRSLFSIAVGRDPVAGAWDSSNGIAYLASFGSDTLSEFSNTSRTLAGTIRIGATPGGVAAPLPVTGGFAVGVSDAATVDAIAQTSGALGTSTALNGTPVDLAFAPGGTELYATVRPFHGGNGSLVAIVPGGGSAPAVRPLGGAPDGLAIDAARGEVYVAESADRTVAVYDVASATVVARVAIPNGSGTERPTAVRLALDPTLDRLYASAGSSNASVAVLNASGRTVLASFATRPDPEGILYVPRTGELYVAEPASGAVSVLDPATGRLVANFTLPGSPSNLSYDAAQGLVFVTCPADASLVALDPVRRVVVGNWSVGTAPTGIAFDPVSSQLLVTDPGQGSVALFGAPPPRYDVNFSETGLNLTGGGWAVDLDGSRYAGGSPTISVALPNGTHDYVVEAVPPLVPAPSNGSVDVLGGPVAVAVRFALATYRVVFNEVGLPNGTAWWADMGGTNRSSANASIAFAVPNGSYAYAVGAGGGFAPRAGTDRGFVTVNGFPPAALRIVFVPRAPYTVTFAEVGLPTGTSWSVVFAGATFRGTGPSIAVPVANGTWTFQVPRAGTFRPIPPFGSVSIVGRSQNVSVTFVAAGVARFLVQFLALGLPSGGVISVRINGSDIGGIARAVVFLPNGTYPFTVYVPEGLRADPSTGTVTVAGRPVNVSISFAARVPSGPLDNLPFVAGIVLAAAAAVAIVAVLAVRRWRRREGGSAEVVEGELIRSGPESGSHGGPRSAGERGYGEPPLPSDDPVDPSEER